MDPLIVSMNFISQQRFALMFAFFTLSIAIAQRQPWPIKVDRIGSCCSTMPQSSASSNYNISYNGKLLQECVNEQLRPLIELYKNSEVSILSLAAPGIGDHAIDDIDIYSPFHEANVGAYAEFRQYQYRIYSQLPSEIAELREPDFRWNKIPLLMLALDTWAKSSEYIVWIDSDAIITDFNFDVKVFAEAHEGAEILASADIRLGLINTGFIILRNSEWNREFLQQWWTIADRNNICDQDAFDMVYKSMLAKDKHSKSLRSRIRIFPMNVLNTHPPAWKYHTEQDRILHLMGESPMYRAMVFRDAWHSICKARSGGVLPPQLGITRHRMLLHAQRVYRDLTQLTFSRANETGAMRDMEELSKASHHYVDILQYIASQKQQKEKEKQKLPFGSSIDINTSSETYLEEILHIRYGVFNLIVEHLKLYRNELRFIARESNETAEITTKRKFILQQVVALLKKAAEAGNSLFWVSRGLENRKLIGQQVLDILDDLSVRVVDAHKPRPLHMKALMFQNLGMTLYEEAMHHARSNPSTESKQNFFVKKSLFMDAEVYFHQSIRLFDQYWQLTEHLSSQSSVDKSLYFIDTAVHREYVQSLQLHAGVLCLLRRFKEGLSEWERAIAAATNTVQGLQVGPDYEKLALIYYNAAVCHAEYGVSVSNSSGFENSSKDYSHVKIDILNAGFSLVDRSLTIVQDIISQQRSDHQQQSNEEFGNASQQHVLLGYDEITDLEAFKSQVKSLKQRIREKVTDTDANSYFTERNEDIEDINVNKKEKLLTVIEKKQPHHNDEIQVMEGQMTMKRIVLPDGSVKYSLQQPRNIDGASKLNPNMKEDFEAEQEDEEEWEECSEVDDADCIAFDIEEIKTPEPAMIESCNVSTNDNGTNVTTEIITDKGTNTSSIPEITSSLDHEDDDYDSYYYDSYDDYYDDEYYYSDDYYYDDESYYYDDYDEYNNSISSSDPQIPESSQNISLHSSIDGNLSENVLFDGLDSIEVQDLKAARERHRRRNKVN